MKKNAEKKKELTISDRVDIMLKEGVDNPKKWATVHGYEEPALENYDPYGWATEWRKLRTHHLEETNFLFEMLRELARRESEATQTILLLREVHDTDCIRNEDEDLDDRVATHLRDAKTPNA